jgi:hypothetical protein
MTTLYYILCSYETWYHAREVFAVLALAYLVVRAH